MLRRLVLASVLAVSAALPMSTAHAQPALTFPEPKPSLVVSGRGEVSVRPDRAVVNVGASFQTETAGEAQEKVNTTVRRVIDAVKAAGIAEEQIQTQGLSLTPIYDYSVQREGQAPRVTGYRAQNLMRIQVDSVDAAGRVLDAAAKAGANEIQGISFELKDDSTARRQALALAMTDARGKAEALAGAASVSLAPVPLEITEGGGMVMPPQPLMARSMAMAAESAAPVQPGTVKVEASVSVRYAITAGR
jgi:uncharacterized protein